jgi:hypothetical protein
VHKTAIGTVTGPGNVLRSGKFTPYKKQRTKKATRQALSREFPPQSEKSSLVSRLLETIPDHINEEKKKSVAKKKIKSWVKL